MNRILGVLCVVMVVLTGCATTIGAIYEKPEVYHGKELEISGVVSDIISIPLTTLSVYMLKDDTGEIPVFSIIPRDKGNQVSIKVKVIAVSAENITGVPENVIKDLEQFLVEQEIIDKNIVSAAAGGIVGVVKNAGDVFDGIYLLLENQE